MKLYEYSYGLVPVRYAKSKRIQKKWNKKYGYRLAVVGKTEIPVNPIKENVFKSFCDLTPDNPEDPYWNGKGALFDGVWKWDSSILLLKLEEILKIKNVLTKEN